MKAQHLVETLLELTETVVVAKQSLQHKTFKKQLYDIKHSDYKLFAATEKKYKRWRLEPASVNFEHKYEDLYAVELPHGYHAVCSIDGPLSGAVVLWLALLNYKDYGLWLDNHHHR